MTFTIYSRIIGDHVNEWSELKNISGTVQLELNGTLLHIPRLDALIYIQEGMLFQVRFKGFVRKGLEEQVFYLFSVNAPPISTTAETGCKVEPKEGSAILTDFYIDCLGFYDTDTPIRYAFKYTFSHSMIIIQDGTVGNVTTKLPLGDRSKDYERVLQLQIIDAYGEFSTVLITIKVRQYWYCSSWDTFKPFFFISAPDGVFLTFLFFSFLFFSFLSFLSFYQTMHCDYSLENY